MAALARHGLCRRRWSVGRKSTTEEDLRGQGVPREGQSGVEMDEGTGLWAFGQTLWAAEAVIEPGSERKSI